MIEHFTWEEDFLGGDRVELRDSIGRLLGDVRRVGGSWVVTFITGGRGEQVAFRPDRESAQKCLTDLVRAGANA